MADRERKRPGVRRWGSGGGDGGLPDIEDLTGPDTDPRETYRAAREQLGLDVAPRPRSGEGLPDVSGWRDELGLGLMALSRYVLTGTVAVSAGTAATMTPGEPGTGGAASHGDAATTGGPLFPVTYLTGTAVVLDPAGTVFAGIGGGNLRVFTDGTDNVGHAALSN